MDDETRSEFKGLNDKLDTFILTQTTYNGNFKTDIGILKQRLDNGDRQEETEIKKRTLRFSYDRLVVTVVVGAFGIFEVLSKMGVIK